VRARERRREAAAVVVVVVVVEAFAADMKGLKAIGFS